MYILCKNTHFMWKGNLLWKKNSFLLLTWKYTLVCVLTHDCVYDDYYLRLRETCGPRHDKTNKMSVRLAKTHISLGIRPVWSESSLCAQCVAKDTSFLHDSEDPDQTGQMPRLIWDFPGRTCHFVGFVMSQLILYDTNKDTLLKSDVYYNLGTVSRDLLYISNVLISAFSSFFFRHRGLCWIHICT